MPDTAHHIAFAPFRALCLLILLLSLHRRSILQQSVGSILPSVQHHILCQLQQLWFHGGIDLQQSGIDNPHIHACLNGVIEEHRVHRLPDRVIAAERKRQVAHSAAHPCKREVSLNILSGFYVINSVVIVLLDACGDSQNIRIDEDILRRKTGFLRQQTVRSVSHLPASLECGSLSLLIEEHHHCGSAVTPHQPCFLQEFLLTLLQADGVDNRLALYALQSCLQHFPL